ncbi:MAG: hypothetical protein WC816_11395 [Sphingomonas sp.]|jgi:protein ImuA
MRDSIDRMAMLRSRIAVLERQRPAMADRQQATNPDGGTDMLAFGHAAIDAALSGGLARGRLHELFAASEGDSGAAAGFAAMLATLAVRGGPSLPHASPPHASSFHASSGQAGTVIWLRERLAEVRGGCLHAPGLAELGLDPGRVILGVLDDPLALLRVASDVVRCGQVSVVVIELWRQPRLLDLTASRRLAVAAEQSGVTALMLRAEAEPTASAAQTRWSIASAAAVPLEADAPGFPTLDLELLRQRGGPSGLAWRVEWDRDQGQFCEPTLSRAVVPLSQRGPLVPRARRA